MNSRSVRRVGIGCLRFASAALVLASLASAPADTGTPAAAPPPAAAAAPGAVPAEIVDALRGLKTADEAGRQKTYDLMGQKGDARLIPALKAYRDGSLQLRDDGRLVLYGERVNVPGKGAVLPLVDALTGESVASPDGQPAYFARPDLSKAIKSPPRSERGPINDLVSALSLLDPNPDVRIRSIQDVGERAGRAFIDAEEAGRFTTAAAQAVTVLNEKLAKSPDAPEAAALKDAAAALAALPADKPTDPLSPSPTAAATGKALAAVGKAEDALKATPPATTAPAAGHGPNVADALAAARVAGRSYQDRIDGQQKVLDELPKYLTAVKRQLDKEPAGRFAPALRESRASLEVVLGDRPTRLAAANTLGQIGTGRAANLLRRLADAAGRSGDAELAKAAADGRDAAERYQTKVRFVQNTFAGLSLGSILVLLALGLSIVFGLMGVINMAHGEFMMVGAFTTYCVSEGFKHLPGGWFNWYPVAAVPAAFLAAGIIGLLVEWLVVRHLYGRPLETLLATWGISLILIQAARVAFGDTLSVTPPKWLEGGVEVMTDLTLPLNRVYIILFCVLCICAVYYIVNRTKLGLLLRATTQNREMAAALGVPTRRVDALTFAFGAGLAGLAGVVVPLYNKINPGIGQEYVVDSFMVVVVGGVGKLAGVIWSGFGLGFVGKYLEPILSMFPSFASGSSVLGRVLVLAAIVVFLQWRPSGLFPPKGRMADA